VDVQPEQIIRLVEARGIPLSDQVA
jgi:hypothetical protein